MVEPIIQCPNCQINTIDTITDEGFILFSCERCDWQKVERYPFNVGAWNVTIHQALAPFDILQSLLTDNAIVDFLKPRLKGISHLSRPISNFEMGDDYYMGEIEIANRVYLGQMIVLAITYAELVINDFYRCLFGVQPQRMHPFLSSDGKGKATVEFNEILKADSKDILIENLVERAAGRASSSKPDKILEKLFKESAFSLKLPLIRDLRELNELRNTVVHEGKDNNITAQRVIDGFGQILVLLYVLGEIAIKFGVVTLDETGFLYASRQKLQNEEPE